MFRRGLVGLFLVCCLAMSPGVCLGKGLSKASKKKVEDRYKRTRDKQVTTILVVAREGIPAGLDAASFQSSGFDGGAYSLKKSAPEVEIREGKIAKVKSRTETEYSYQLGTLLIIERVRIRDDRIEFETRSLKQPAMREAPPAGLQLYERSKLKFYFNKSVMESDQLDVVLAAMDEWVKPFDNRTEAQKFSVGIAGVRVQFGMTFAEVEALAGPPDRKEEDGDRVVYYYQNLTVEFIGGRATRYASK